MSSEILRTAVISAYERPLPVKAAKDVLPTQGSVDIKATPVPVVTPLDKPKGASGGHPIF